MRRIIISLAIGISVTLLSAQVVHARGFGGAHGGAPADITAAATTAAAIPAANRMAAYSHGESRGGYSGGGQHGSQHSGAEGAAAGHAATEKNEPQHSGARAQRRDMPRPRKTSRNTPAPRAQRRDMPRPRGTSHSTPAQQGAAAGYAAGNHNTFRPAQGMWRCQPTPAMACRQPRQARLLTSDTIKRRRPVAVSTPPAEPPSEPLTAAPACMVTAGTAPIRRLESERLDGGTGVGRSHMAFGWRMVRLRQRAAGLLRLWQQHQLPGRPGLLRRPTHCHGRRILPAGFQFGRERSFT